MNRRSFLTGMAGILSAGCAPWVVTHAGVLMPVRQRVWMPEKRIVAYTEGNILTTTGGHIEMWRSRNGSTWEMVASEPLVNGKHAGWSLDTWERPLMA